MEFSKEYAVQMQDITIRFGSHCALNKVQLSVKKGTVHAILGENGAGKTTLMNILYGLYQKNAGEIYLLWKEGRNQKSKRRDLKGNWNGTSAFHAGRKFYRDTEYHSGK